MKFIIVASYADFIVNFRGGLIDDLMSKGFLVHVVSPGLYPESPASLSLLSKGVIIHNIEMQRTGINPLKDFTYFINLLRIVSNIKAKYMLSYTIKPVIYGNIVGFLAKIPYRYSLITGLGYLFTEESKKVRIKDFVKFIAKILYKFSLNFSEKIIFQNSDDLDLFKKIGVTSSKSLTFVVNGSGVDLSFYKYTPPPKKLNFLIIARLLGDKGVREFFAAACKTKEKYPGVSFSIAGWIDENPNAISQGELDDWIDSGVIDYLGKLDDVCNAIQECSVYVLPSYREGIPRTVLEAMSIGRPVITTDAPGCKDTVKNDVNGFKVPVKSVAKLAEKMIWFIENDSQIKKMGLESRKMVEDKFDVRKVNKEMLKIMGIK